MRFIEARHAVKQDSRNAFDVAHESRNCFLGRRTSSSAPYSRGGPGAGGIVVSRGERKGLRGRERGSGEEESGA